MFKNNRGKLVWLGLVVALLLATAGCAGTVSQAQPQVVYPTVVIVQYVTQVVATVTPAPPGAAAAAQPPAATKYVSANVGYDPLREQIYYPLMGCQVASRLHIGQKAFVANGGGQIGLHMSEDIGFAPEFRKLVSGEVVDIVGGPYCARQSLVWQILGSDGQKGYAAEGDGNTYWLLPNGDLVEKEKLKATPDQQALRLGLPSYCKPR